MQNGTQQKTLTIFISCACDTSGYKLPESAAGSGNTGLSGQNYNQQAFANGGKQPQTVQEEMGISLSNNFNLANTKAEAKGEENL